MKKSFLALALICASISPTEAVAVPPERGLDSVSITSRQGQLVVESSNIDGTDNRDIAVPVEGAGVRAITINGRYGYMEYAPVGADSRVNDVVAIALPGENIIAWSAAIGDVTVSHATGEIEYAPSEANFVIDTASTSEPAIGLYQVATSPAPGGELTSADFAALPLVQIADNSLSARAAALATVTALATTSSFRQTTFIPSAYLGAPAGQICTPDARQFRFQGDNRTWSSSDAAKYRTRMSVSVNWANATPTLGLTRGVGETVREVQNSDGSWSVERRATASSASMSLTATTLTSNLVAFNLHQDVVNPMCNSFFTNGIAANTSVQMYRSGIVTGSIAFLQMPNYELYFRQDAGAWKTVKLLPLVDAGCLAKFFGAVCNTTVPFP